MKNLYVKLFCLLSIKIWSVACVADVSQSDIRTALGNYPRSSIVENENRAVLDYPVSLGEMKKKRGLWAPERERRLAGNLQRVTLRLPDGHSPQQAFAFYFDQLIDLGARILYQCESRACGESNAWANNLYQIKELYGLDREQSYAAFELLDDKGELQFVSVYTVIRGNKRVYAHTEWLQTQLGEDDITAPSADDIGRALKTQGYFVVGGVSINDGQLQINQPGLQTLVAALFADRRSKIKIVGRDQSSSDAEGQGNEVSDQNESIAQQFAKALERNGIPALRLSTETLNPSEFQNQTGVNEKSLIKIERLSNN